MPQEAAPVSITPKAAGINWSELMGQPLGDQLPVLRDRTILWIGAGVTQPDFVNGYKREYVGPQDLETLKEHWQPYGEWTDEDTEYRRPQQRFFQAIHGQLADLSETQRSIETVEASLRLAELAGKNSVTAQALRQVFLPGSESLFLTLGGRFRQRLAGWDETTLLVQAQEQVRPFLRLVTYLRSQDPGLMTRFPWLEAIAETAQELEVS